MKRIRRLADPLCTKCGNPIIDAVGCYFCETYKFHFDSARSWARYEGELRFALLALKQGRKPKLGERLTNELLTLFREQEWNADYVVTIPSASIKSFDHLSLLAAPFTRKTGIPIFHALVRSTGKPQKNLGAVDRFKNVIQIFEANESVRGQNILLLDDVMTTGATLDSAAKALKVAGANNIWGLTIARSVLKNQPRQRQPSK
jgi:ComF family protein